MTAHPIPATMLALYGRVRAATADDSAVRVDLGPTSEYEEPDAIAIGLAPLAAEAVTGLVESAGLDSDRDTFDLTCSAQSVSGDDDPATRLVRVFELVDAVRSELPGLVVDLDGLVWSAGIVRESLTWVQVHEAVGALVEFTVRVTADRLL